MTEWISILIGGAIGGIIGGLLCEAIEYLWDKIS